MRLLQKFPRINHKLALGFSLVLASALSLAGPYGDLKQKLDHAKSNSDVIRIVRGSGQIANQTDVKASLSDYDSEDVDDAKAAKNLRTMVDLGAMGEGRATADKLDQQAARAIKDSPLYKDPGIDQKRNWLADALERLKNIRPKQERTESNGMGLGLLGPIFTFFVWGLLAAAIATLLYFAIRHFSWQKSLTRKVKALLEEDEPLRTLDEWLQLADEHAAAGRYREAVRALYLACLLKFDENDVARFERGETNWEHLARIEQSPKLPVGLNFRTPTQRFDRIWYGYQTQGLPDVELFRTWYQDITNELRSKPA